MQMLGDKFGTMITVFNPMYLLHFERFGDGNLDDDPDFKSHVARLVHARTRSFL